MRLFRKKTHAPTDNANLHEQKMAQWLSHPTEYGVPPKWVRYKSTFHVARKGGQTPVHIVEYELPDGQRGRGFVNEGLTWSFRGKELNEIPDEILSVAYVGWAWLFTALQNKAALPDFKNEGEEKRFLAILTEAGYEDVALGSNYQVGTSFIWEFKATKSGEPYSGAGDTESHLAIPATNPICNVPLIYTFLGRVLTEPSES